MTRPPRLLKARRKTGTGRTVPARTHDLRPMYGPMPGRPLLAAITIEEPGGLLSSDQATREIGRHRDGLLAHPRGEREWVPPTRPTVIVAQSIRGDPLGQMFARHQIAPVLYFAGRGYQELHVLARAGRLRSSDPCLPHIPGSAGMEPVTDAQRSASARLRGIDAAVVRYVGRLGLYVARGVLVEARTLAQVGILTGTDKRTRGFLLGAALTTMATRLGMATRLDPESSKV